jgi:hypothetical protein
LVDLQIAGNAKSGEIMLEDADLSSRADPNSSAR